MSDNPAARTVRYRDEHGNIVELTIGLWLRPPATLTLAVEHSCDERVFTYETTV